MLDIKQQNTDPVGDWHHSDWKVSWHIDTQIQYYTMGSLGHTLRIQGLTQEKKVTKARFHDLKVWPNAGLILT